MFGKCLPRVYVGKTCSNVRKVKQTIFKPQKCHETKFKVSIATIDVVMNSYYSVAAAP